MLYMVTCTINIPPMLAYIPAPWILWVCQFSWQNVDAVDAGRAQSSQDLGANEFLQPHWCLGQD